MRSTLPSDLARRAREGRDEAGPSSIQRSTSGCWVKAASSLLGGRGRRGGGAGTGLSSRRPVLERARPVSRRAPDAEGPPLRAPSAELSRRGPARRPSPGRDLSEPRLVSEVRRAPSERLGPEPPLPREAPLEPADLLEPEPPPREPPDPAPGDPLPPRGLRVGLFWFEGGMRVPSVRRGNATLAARRPHLPSERRAIPANRSRSQSDEKHRDENAKNGTQGSRSSAKEIRRRPTLPGTLVPSTIGAGGLNFRVRDGNGCDPSAMATEICCQLRAAIRSNRICGVSRTS